MAVSIPGGNIPSFGGYASPFSFDAVLQHEPWMASLPDTTLLTEMSIPGTHDTMTRDIGIAEFRCQNTGLDTQLRAGIRYLDIRLRLRGRELHVFHADRYAGHSLEDVFENVFSFLSEFPSEGVIVRAKKEGPAWDGDETIAFEDAFEWVRTKSARTAEGCSRHLLLPPETGFARIPTLRALRGKVLILQEFSSTARIYGIPWQSELTRLQDYWILRNIFDLPRKWVAIQDSLFAVAETKPGADAPLYLSHASAAHGVRPIAVAAGPLESSVGGMNDVLGEWLEHEGDGGPRTGVVILDFPGQRLIEAILARNQKLKGS